MIVRFVRKDGPAKGKAVEFDQQIITIGRVAGRDINFEGVDEPNIKRVSADHCEVYEEDGGYYVRDKGSTNGTLLDGVKINGPKAIRSGALVKLGEKGPEFCVLLKMTASEDLVQPAAAPAEETAEESAEVMDATVQDAAPEQSQNTTEEAPAVGEPDKKGLLGKVGGWFRKK